MAFGIVQHAKVGALTGTATQTISLTNPVTSGNRLILGVVEWDGTHIVTSITDNLGETWNGPLTRTADADSTDTTLWDAVVTVAGTITVTCHANGGTANQWSVFLVEVSGLSTATSGYLDGTAHAIGNSTGPAASGAASPAATANGEFAIGLAGDGGYSDSGSMGNVAGAWTKLDTTVPGSNAEGTFGYLTAGTTSGTGPNFQTGTLGSSHPWAADVAVFKLAGVATSPPIQARGRLVPTLPIRRPRATVAAIAGPAQPPVAQREILRRTALALRGRATVAAAAGPAIPPTAATTHLKRVVATPAAHARVAAPAGPAAAPTPARGRLVPRVIVLRSRVLVAPTTGARPPTAAAGRLVIVRATPRGRALAAGAGPAALSPTLARRQLLVATLPRPISRSTVAPVYVAQVYVGGWWWKLLLLRVP